MSCEAYRKKLSDVLLRGEVALGATLVQHMQACAACHEFYEAQKRLLGAMDAGVRAMVSAEVPPSLVPGIRAGMRETVIGRAWSAWIVPAVGVLVVTLFACIPLLRWNFPQKPPEVRVEVAGTPVRIEGEGEAQTPIVRSGNPVRVVKRPSVMQDSQRQTKAPEVIVLPAERAALARIASTGPLIVDEPQTTEAANNEIEGPGVKPLKIEEIVIPPVEFEND